MASYLAGAAAAVLAAFVALGFLRRALWRPGPAHGDPALAEVLGTVLPRPARRAAVVVVDRTGTRSAFVRADGHTRFELGSVSKALTGLAVAAELEAGAAAGTLDDLLADLDDSYAGSALGRTTVRELCTHSSGLPTLPRTPRTALRGFAAGLFGLDPYRRVGAERVVRDARRQRLGGAGYSNLGAAVLGNAIAHRAGCSYDTLMHRDVFDPLGMADTGLSGERRFRARRGWSPQGRRPLPWAQSGYAPAGGVTSTPDDLARLLAALVHETARGLAALHPIAELPGGPRIGMFWLVTDRGSHGTRRWHNGRTAGYAAFLAVDDERGVAVVADVGDSAAVEALAAAVYRKLR